MGLIFVECFFRFAQTKARDLQSQNGEIKLLKTQLKEKDEEIKSYLERAVSAEKKLEFLKEEKRK